MVILSGPALPLTFQLSVNYLHIFQLLTLLVLLELLFEEADPFVVDVVVTVIEGVTLDLFKNVTIH